MADSPTAGVDARKIRDFVVREVEQAKKDLLNQHKAALIEASAGDHEVVDRVGGAPGPVTEGLREDLAAEYDIPEDARIAEVHFEVGEPITVRYIDPNQPADSDDSGGSE